MATDTDQNVNDTAPETAPTQIAKINNKRYEVSKLPETALKLIASVRMADEEMTRLERSLTIAKAARVAYSQALFAAVKDQPSLDDDEAPAPAQA